MVTTPNGPAVLRRQRMAGLEMAVLERPGFRELHLTLRPQPRELPCAMFGRLAALLKEHDATVVRHEVFGYLDASGEGLQHLRASFGEITWPITWIEGSPCGGGQLAGMHVMAVAGTPVETLSLDDRPIGRIYQDGLGRHCLIGDVRSSHPQRTPAEQTKEVYGKLEAALALAGMSFQQVMRTWFFLDDILSWYDDFNIVRNEFFKSHRIGVGLIPASTGISGKNRNGSVLAVGAWATQAINPAYQLLEVPSPLQCPAPKYGSGFSRAVEFAAPDHRRILVSGTASINPDGTSARPDDIDGQIDLTMDVIGAILNSRGMAFSDVTRCTAYLKRDSYAPALAKWCADRGLKSLPIIMTEAAVCRDELLYEIELDAMTTQSPITA